MPELSKDELIQACEKALQALESLRETMPAPSFNKCLVCIAYEYVCIGDFNGGLALLLRVPHDYYKNDQLEQMRGDPVYAEICRTLIERLAAEGLLRAIPFTQPQARA